MMHSRMFVRPLGWTLVGLLCLATAVRGQESLTAGEESAGEDPVHNELRALRDESLDAFLKKDIERLQACLHPNVVAILQNAEVCRGHDGVRAFHKRMSEGDDRTVLSQKTDFEVEELARIYDGDTAVSYGTITDHFVLRNGMEFDLVSKWTATCVKDDNRWLVASFQASTNMFDNGVSDMMLKWNSIKTGGGGLLAGGLAAGGLLMLWRRRA
jgi:ketosteroid isomerase-like protein